MLRSLSKGATARPERPGATRAVVVVISPTDVPVAAAVIDQLENVELTSLHRYTLSGLRAWPSMSSPDSPTRRFVSAFLM
jgi:hypothetical protein